MLKKNLPDELIKTAGFNIYTTEQLFAIVLYIFLILKSNLRLTSNLSDTNCRCSQRLLTIDGQAIYGPD